MQMADQMAVVHAMYATTCIDMTCMRRPQGQQALAHRHIELRLCWADHEADLDLVFFVGGPNSAVADLGLQHDHLALRDRRIPVAQDLFSR